MVDLDGLVSSTIGGAVNDLAKKITGSSDVSSGNRAYIRGLPLMLRTSRYATVHTKANRTIQAMPRQKFMFYATFNPGPKVKNNPEFSSWQRGFAFQIAKVDRPKISPKVEEKNQYNRKRLIHTGIEFNDLNITLHDTVDDRVLKVWRDYYLWYFGQGRPKKAAASWRTPVIEGREDFSIGNGWGFAPPGGDWNTSFFESLDIYTFYGKKYTSLRIYNPKITNITFDAMETESSALATAEMTIKHEGYEYTAVSQRMGNKQIEMFNLNGGDYFEPTDSFGGVNSFLLDLNDSFESTLDGILGSVRSIPFVGGVLAGLGSNAIRASGVTGFLPRIAGGLASTTLGRWGNFG